MVLRKLAAFYALLRRGEIKAHGWAFTAYARVVWLFPYAIHSEKAGKTGRALRRLSNDEVNKLCFCLHSERNSISCFRSLLKKARSKSTSGKVFVDWDDMGTKVFFWNAIAQDKIHREYWDAVYGGLKED